ncbi:VOC family protein [Oleiharenicola lentus]|uniref:VOC family protein n=1 Tax=Oleiharenicola lentus TaxID=2508720 RepID=UPI003F664CFB
MNHDLNTRRNFLVNGAVLAATPWSALIAAGSVASTQPDKPDHPAGSMQIHYLEIVARNAAVTCNLYQEVYGLVFGEADKSLGGARTARLAGGTLLGIRSPMHGGEKPVTRPYYLVADITAAVAAATKHGAEIAVPPMDIPGRGKCAIIISDGIESGLWQI